MPDCVAFADVRGDFRLVVTLLTDVMKVATYEAEHKTWDWSVKDTVVICTGNFIDRYGKKGGPEDDRSYLPLSVAIEDENQVLDCFTQLRQKGKAQGDNAMIVLIGDHELGNLLSEWDEASWDRESAIGYELDEIQDDIDLQSRREWVRDRLIPFCLECGVVAGWGVEGSMVYFSHGGLERAWFERLRAKSIQDVNRKYRAWLRDRNRLRLPVFRESDSPLVSTKVATDSLSWRNEDRDYLAALLGPDPYPYFVTSCLSTFDLRHRNLDPYLCWPVPGLAVSQDSDGTDQVFFIRNEMADVYCDLGPRQARPLALRFILEDEGLTLNWEVLTGEERTPCPRPALPARPTPAPFVPASPLNDRYIWHVVVLVFSHRPPRLLTHWNLNEKHSFRLPRGARDRQETVWSAAERCARDELGVVLRKEWLQGAGVDYHHHTRVLIFQAPSRSIRPDQRKAQWVDQAHLGNDEQLLPAADRSFWGLLVSQGWLPDPQRTRQGVTV